MTAQDRWLVLVGGGACGRWQAGALRTLYDAGLLTGLDGIIGTSVGGLNACALALGIAQGKGTAVLEDAWNRIQKDADVYAPSLTAVVEHPWAHPFDEAGLSRGFLFGPGACSTDALEKLVREIMGGWSTEKIKAAGGPVVLTRALSYGMQRAETLTGDLVPMALCTSAIEGVFPRRWGRGDGGAVDNEPIGVALAQGATQLLVVFCGPDDPASAADAAPTVVRETDRTGDASTGLKDALAVLAGVVAHGEALADEAAARAEAQGVQVVYCYPPADTGSALDFRPRGLFERGQAEAAPAVGHAKTLGWI